MKKKVLAVACCLMLLVAAGACKKKEQPAQPQAGAPGQQQLPPGHPPTPGGPGGQGGVVMPQGETSVNLPPTVQGKWKAVVIAVEDKAAKKTSEHTVNVNGEFKIPGSNLKVSVGDFIPDFKMDGLNITSLSNEPNNPACRVKVFEGDKEIFKGWLYSKFPTIHPFEHPKYGLMLKSGVKK